MTLNYPIIETQLRLIRALQRGYAEALEAGDWQAAEYRCAHLHRLCEGLHHLSYLLDRGNALSTVAPQNQNNWVGTIRGNNPMHALNQSLETNDKPLSSRPLPPEPPPIDEVWNQ